MSSFLSVGSEHTANDVHATLCALVTTQAATHPAWAEYAAVLLDGETAAFFSARLDGAGQQNNGTMGYTNRTGNAIVNAPLHSLHRSIGTICPSLPISNFGSQFFDPVDTVATAYTIYLLVLLVPFCHEVVSNLRIMVWARTRILKASHKIRCISESFAPKTETAATETKAEEPKGIAEEASKATHAFIDDHGITSTDDISSVVRIILCWLQVPLFLAGAFHFYSSVVPAGVSWQCTALFWAAAPMAKAIAIPMWVILMPTGQFAHWLLNRHKTPIQQTGIPAGKPPLPMNGLTLVLMVVTAFFFLVWMATALPVILLLVAFPITTTLQFLAIPVVIQVLLPMVLGSALRKLGSKAQGVDQQYTLKIAAAQGICATSLAVSFLPLYDPRQSNYWDLTVSSLEVVAAMWEPMVQSFVRLGAFLSSWHDFTHILPSSFSWPELPGGFSLAFNISVALAAFAAVMPQLVMLYKHFNLDSWGEKYFELEEVEYDEKKSMWNKFGVKPENDSCRTIIGYVQNDKAHINIVDQVNVDQEKVKVKIAKTGRTRLKKGQCPYMVAVVLERAGMAGAAVLSFAQNFLVLVRNRKPLKHSEENKRRKAWWSMEQKGWSERNYDHVNHAAVQQFVVDNPHAATLHLASCTNLTLGTMQAIASTWKGEELNMGYCELKGM
jgi:hypothetical protein